MEHNRRQTIRELFLEGTEIDAALQRAVREAARQHKLAGLPMVVWRDGKAVWVSPDEFLPGDEAAAANDPPA